jgi:hypothetical protein
MKTGPESLGTIQNGSESAKYESWTRCPRYHPKRLRAQNTTTEPGAHGTADNESESTKHENGTQRPRFRQK